MGEVSGDSSSPLLEIPFPISQEQRAGLHCQAPTQLCYLSLSPHACMHACTHARTHIYIETSRQNRHHHFYNLDCPLFLRFTEILKQKTTLISPVSLHPSLTPTHNARSWTLTHTNARSGRWRVSIFSLSAYIPIYFTFKNTQRGIEQIICKSAPSLTYSYNTPICFFSIIKHAFSSCFLSFLWHRDLCSMQGENW